MYCMIDLWTILFCSHFDKKIDLKFDKINLKLKNCLPLFFCIFLVLCNCVYVAFLCYVRATIIAFSYNAEFDARSGSSKYEVETVADNIYRVLNVLGGFSRVFEF